MKRILGKTVRGIWHLLFPNLCEVCGEKLIEGEELLCLKCRYAMPRTNLHRDATSLLHERLASPGLPVERTASYFYYFRDNVYARLIQEAKYNGRRRIARTLGADFARELAADNFFDGIDLMLPIPLHWFKKMKRGYNQSEDICLGINGVTGIPIGDNLCVRYHSTQTRKNAFERMKNVAGIMSVTHPEELEGKHILLVDDVITTGATIMSAARAILEAVPTARISVLSLGCTKLR